MDKREKVIKGLDEISQYFYGCYRNAGGGTRACEKFHDWMCAVDEAKDALNLLKAQEPRVMTLEEVKATPYDVDIWIETEYYVGKITIFAATINTNGLRGVMVYGSHKIYDYEAYNKLWRCWTSRPTEEQREAVKWE